MAALDPTRSNEARERKREYQRRFRERQREKRDSPSGTPPQRPKAAPKKPLTPDDPIILRILPPPQDAQQGTVRQTVTQACECEFERLPLARRREADVETALRMALILDNPKAWPQWSGAALRLKSLMDSLRAGEADGQSRLAAFRAARAAG